MGNAKVFTSRFVDSRNAGPGVWPDNAVKLFQKPFGDDRVIELKGYSLDVMMDSFVDYSGIQRSDFIVEHPKGYGDPFHVEGEVAYTAVSIDSKTVVKRSQSIYKPELRPARADDFLKELPNVGYPTKMGEELSIKFEHCNVRVDELHSAKLSNGEYRLVIDIDDLTFFGFFNDLKGWNWMWVDPETCTHGKAIFNELPREVTNVQDAMWVALSVIDCPEGEGARTEVVKIGGEQYQIVIRHPRWVIEGIVGAPALSDPRNCQIDWLMRPLPERGYDVEEEASHHD